jgi:hypothetical protein
VLISFMAVETMLVLRSDCHATVPRQVYALGMAIKIPAKLREAMTEIARKFGREGGKKAARNATPEERSARAKKASIAAAKKRTEERLARLKQSKAAKKRTKGKGTER